MADNYSIEELEEMGLEVGDNVRIHKTVQFFGSNVKIGSNVRIDCFSLITSDSPVVIGNHIHFGAGVHIFGQAGVSIADYCNLSSRCSVFTSADDFTDGYMTNPTVPDKFKKVRSAPVRLHKHVIIGCGSVIMPGVTLHEGASVGALSFVNRNVEAFSIVAGTPIRKIGKRNEERLCRLEQDFESNPTS